LPDFRRIGDKLLSRERLISLIDEILALRQAGLSQQDTALRIGTDRSFISRLETLGEVRKGASVAVVGLPVANKDEILAVTAREGVDFTFILSEDERWSFLQGKSGFELFSEAATLLERVTGHDVVIILGHNRPAQVIDALLHRRSLVLHLSQVEGREAYFDPDELSELLARLRKRESG
jgi:transcriptional regulator with XRE-family HTH domain